MDYRVARNGPSAVEVIAAAMRADRSLTLERAVREVPVTQEALERYEQAAADLEARMRRTVPGSFLDTGPEPL